MQTRIQSRHSVRTVPTQRSAHPAGLFLNTLISVLDRAILAVYRQAGIAAYPATHHRPAPLLKNLAATLGAVQDTAARGMAARLAPWVDGTLFDLFMDPPPPTRTGHVVVWSLRHLPDELRTADTLPGAGFGSSQATFLDVPAH